MNKIVLDPQGASLPYAEALPALRGLLGGATVVTPTDAALPVERLQPGDRVITRSGLARVRAVHHRRAPWLAAIRIHAHAIAPGVPDRDVVVASEQVVALPASAANRRVDLGDSTAVLLPLPLHVAAAQLVNGTTVTQELLHDADVYDIELPEAGFLYAACLSVASAP